MRFVRKRKIYEDKVRKSFFFLELKNRTRL